MQTHTLEQKLKWTFLIVIFILLRTFFALLWDVIPVGATKECSPFANHVVGQRGTESVGLAKCEPDGKYATVGHKQDSFLILDMGAGNEIIDGPGIDFYYYERPNGPGILLDWVEVAVAQEDESEIAESFVLVFIWGDENPENNGVIPPDYLPEEPNRPINSSDLQNGTGIGIDIGNDDETAYRFVRFKTHPNDATPETDELVEVDAVERVYPSHPPTSTPTPFPTETQTLIPTPSSTETPFFTATATIEPTDTPTVTISASPSETLSPMPSETPTPTSTQTASHTPTQSPTQTITPTLASTSTPTTTRTQTASNTPTTTSTLTDTATPTPTPSHTPTITSTPTNTLTPTASHTPSITPSGTNTRAPTLTSTPTTTRTVTVTFTPSKSPTITLTPSITLTPTITRTPRPRPTRTSTRTPFPYTPGTPEKTLTPTNIKTPTEAYTTTLTITPTPTKNKLHTETAIIIPLKTTTSIFTSTYTPTPTTTPVSTPTSSGTDPSIFSIEWWEEVKKAFPKPATWAEVILGILLVEILLKFIMNLLTALSHKLNEGIIIVDPKRGFVFRPRGIVNLGLYLSITFRILVGIGKSNFLFISLCISIIFRIFAGIGKRLSDWLRTNLNRTQK